jgi:CDP-4-dehydro-6-deoxyglucose reductase
MRSTASSCCTGAPRPWRTCIRPRCPANGSRRKNFSFIPVLSEPGAADHWPGRTGFVHTAVLADFADLSGYEVYACGAPPMMAAAKRDFTARGLPEDAFFSDSFEFQAGS